LTPATNSRTAETVAASLAASSNRPTPLRGRPALALGVQRLVLRLERRAEGVPVLFGPPAVHRHEPIAACTVAKQLGRDVARCAAEKPHPVSVAAVGPQEVGHVFGPHDVLPEVGVPVVHASHAPSATAIGLPACPRSGRPSPLRHGRHRPHLRPRSMPDAPGNNHSLARPSSMVRRSRSTSSFPSRTKKTSSSFSWLCQWNSRETRRGARRSR